MDFTNAFIKNNVIYLTETSKTFSDLYISVRIKENRVLSDKDVNKLPYLDDKEWLLRQKSTQRFIAYLYPKKIPLTILDVGCGNGWFSNAMAKVDDQNIVIGLDINVCELEQASRIFKKENLRFVYADIFKTEATFKNQIDIITLNASVQYFPDFDMLFSTLKTFLKPKGEIHIIDSPFYNNDAIIGAKKRTLDYYTNLGFPNMAKNYFHHSVDNISEFKTLYVGKKNLIQRVLSKNDSPFPWLCYST